MSILSHSNLVNKIKQILHSARSSVYKTINTTMTTTHRGKGFSVDNLENMRRFYLVYRKSETVSRKFKLGWSHYIFLTRLANEDERSKALVEMTLPENNNQIYDSKYSTILPNKEKFQRLLESEDE